MNARMRTLEGDKAPAYASTAFFVTLPGTSGPTAKFETREEAEAYLNKNPNLVRRGATISGGTLADSGDNYLVMLPTSDVPNAGFETREEAAAYLAQNPDLKQRGATIVEAQPAFERARAAAAGYGGSWPAARPADPRSSAPPTPVSPAPSTGAIDYGDEV